MAFIKPYDVTIDIHKGIVEGEFKLRQASDGVRLFKAKLNDGDNKFDLRGYKLQVVFRKRDGNRVDDEISEFDLETSIVEVPVKESVLNVSGLVICEIVVLDMNDVKYITFPPFHFVAEPNEFLGDGVTSTNEFNVLVKALARVDAINEIAEERFAVLDQQVDAKLKEYDNRFLEIKGEKGDVGPQGPQGIQGPKGDKGEKGDTGQDGAKGEVGPQGIRGPEGARGPQGIQGPKGDQGPQGPKGAKGDKGDKGDTGPQGPQGTQGPQGIQGIKGDKGDKGDKGEKGDFGELTDNDRTDYMGITHKSLRDTNNSNVDYAVKTAIGEFNYLDYEGQHITANNSIEGHTKSAILTGCTKFVSEKGGIFETFVDSLLNELVIGKTINGANGIVFDNANEVLTVKFMPVPPTPFRLLGSKDWRKIALYDKEFNYIKTISFRTSDKIDITSSDIENAVYCRLGYAGTEIDSTFRITDTNNANIPYPNLVMSSVKMPVLKTTGKNLLPLGNSQDLSARGLIVTQKDGKLLINGVTTGTTDYRVFNVNNNVEQMKKFNSLPVGTTITLSNNLGKENYFNVIRNGSSVYLKNTITIQDGDKDINAFIRFNTNETHDNTELYVQIEYGAVATSYEPHKTNILTVNEDLTLRGIGDVRDTLDCLTGEVTERIGEVIFDGSEDEKWTVSTSQHGENTYLTYIRISDAIPSQGNLTIIDKLPYTPISSDLWLPLTDVETYRINHNRDLLIRWNKARFSKAINSVSEFKEYLKVNPITVQYALNESIVKTVDLSDNVVYSYNGTTHYSCSSEDGSLVPTLSVKVPTDVQATIAQQRNTIQALETENEALKDGLIEANQYREDGDMDLLSNQWDIDFRLFEIEMVLDVPMAVAYKIAKENDSMSRFLQAKTLILGGRYERSKMEYQLKRYLEAWQLTQEEYDELISLMDARELVE